MRSIRSALLRWVLGALCLGSVALVLVAYRVSLDEMNEVLDENLHEVATALVAYHLRGHDSQALLPLAAAAEIHDDGELVTQISEPGGSLVFSSNPKVRLPHQMHEGQRVETVEGDEWRIYTRVTPKVVVQVAQRTAARKEMAGEASSRLVIPLVGLTLLIGGLLVFALRRGLRPLDDAAAQMSARTAGSLVPLSQQNAPLEMQPLVAAFNDLMHRLDTAFAAQRRFVADAAHELRTPVAALKLQMQLLERAAGDTARTEAMTEMRGGMERTARLVEQLMQLSRAQPDVEIFRPEPVWLDALVRSVVADFSAFAQRAQVDLGAVTHPETPVSATVDGDRIRIALNNLVRNALHYAPPGSRIDVSADWCSGRARLMVCDSGPGIAQAERQRVLDRFYRGPRAGIHGDPAGSGLGLAIVKAIADRHGAELILASRCSGPGLKVSLLFPAGNAMAAAADGLSF